MEEKTVFEPEGQRWGMEFERMETIFKINEKGKKIRTEERLITQSGVVFTRKVYKTEETLRKLAFNAFCESHGKSLESFSDMPTSEDDIKNAINHLKEEVFSNEHDLNEKIRMMGKIEGLEWVLTEQ